MVNFICVLFVFVFLFWVGEGLVVCEEGVLFVCVYFEMVLDVVAI